MKLNEYKKQIFNKVLFNSRVDYFIDLLIQLSTALSAYNHSFARLRFLKEDKNFSRYNQLKKEIESAKKDIKFVYKNIDKFFKDGNFFPLTENQAFEISNEYQHVVEEMIIIDKTLELDPTYQKFVDLIDFYNKEIKRNFNILSDNIDIYNNKATEEGWKYKLKTYKEAVEYHNKNYMIVEKNHKRTTIAKW